MCRHRAHGGLCSVQPDHHVSRVHSMWEFCGYHGVASAPRSDPGARGLARGLLPDATRTRLRVPRQDSTVVGMAVPGLRATSRYHISFMTKCCKPPTALRVRPGACAGCVL